jgi:hypothetical protein
VGTVQQRILHIKLINRPTVGDGQGEHGVDHDQLDYCAEGLIIVDTGLLGEAVKDPMNLVLFQRVIGAELVHENLFVGEDVGANGARDKILGVVGDQGSKFFFHDAAPIQIDGGTNGGGRQRQGQCRGD